MPGWRPREIFAVQQPDSTCRNCEGHLRFFTPAEGAVLPKIVDYMNAANGRPSGFDYMRLSLSLMVMLAHTANISYGPDYMNELWQNPLARAILTSILPMFFTLSGFLVAGSMERSRTVVKFMSLRFIRIYPALAVDIIFTALVIGPLVTTLSVGAYFSDPEFFSYLKNITGHDIVFTLPGVFENAKSPYVNLQLWTIPFELACYVILGVLMVASVRGRYRWIMLLGTLAYFAAALYLTGVNSGWTFADWDGPVAGRTLVLSFLLGVNFYLWREEIPAGPGITLAVAIITGVAWVVGPFDRIAGVFPAALLTVYLGIANPRRIGVLKSADLSYGIFLYHFAIIQAVVHFSGGSLAFHWTVLISTPIVVGFAALSWNLVEKPALSLRTGVGRLEDWWVGTRTFKRADDLENRLITVVESRQLPDRGRSG